MSQFLEKILEKDKLLRKANDYLYAQRTLKHKVKIFYEEMQNLFIKEDGTSTGIFLDSEKFTKNEFEDLGISNSNNATNSSQLLSEDTYNRNITHDNYMYLDGKTAFATGDDGGLKLLGKNQKGETENVVGWMSRTMCNEDGYFENPVRLMHEFKSDQSIVQWRIRSVANEVPEDFSLCIYDEEKNMIYKKIVEGNKDSSFPIKINRGLCRHIELRITRWGVKDAVTSEILHKSTGAKIVYFYHDAAFPKGATDYKSNDLLQSFSINEYLCSSIGKANYGVQSNTGQFALININKLFDTLKFAGYVKNGLKVQYYVSADKYYEPNLDSTGNVDEEKNKKLGIDRPELLNDGSEDAPEAGSTIISVEEGATALSVTTDTNNWTLLGTHYITDIEFDELKGVVRFKTQDRMIKFKDSTYSGYKKVVSGKLAPIQSSNLIDDIMNRAELAKIKISDEEPNENIVNKNNKLYAITDRAAKAMKNRVISQGYLDEMNIWSALQKTCDMDLIHVYVNRDDLLVIDKIDQL